MISNRLIGLPSQLTANRPRDNREDIHRYHTLPDHCVSSTIKIRQPKQISPIENTTGNSWPAGQMCLLDKQGRNSKQEIAAWVLSPLNQGNKVLLSRTLERYKDLKPMVHILPFLLLPGWCSQRQRAFQDRCKSQWQCLKPLGLSLCSSQAR